jgi:predicted transglutaminase-like cysteine proteinase
MINFTKIWEHFKKQKSEIERGSAEFWNNKWTKNEVIYQAQGTIKRDVRNLICTKSYILEPVAKAFNKQSNDEKALNLLKLVNRILTYKGDFEIKKVAEFWQHPEETYQIRQGDCEDGSLLLISLMRLAGVPAFRVKICAGNVLSPVKTAIDISTETGHCYVIYLSEKFNEWFVLDWCYWFSDSIEAFNKTPHRDMKNYKSIWWTVNDEFSWAQHSTII